MADINWTYYSKLKKEFMREKGLDLEDLGYSMACGLSRLEGKITIAVRIQPLLESPDPIDEGLLAKIKNEVLGDNYKGVSLDIQYVGIISARDKA
ncbi:MAG: hypothetical protein Q8R47_04390 [Nanoarchaeota archaeon]|nr:hypothetical protein [Nanoarchaeota archaeon]